MPSTSSRGCLRWVRWTDPVTAPDPAYRPCVGVMLTDGHGRVWAGERIDTPGAWQMPQGGIDADEEPRAAALRELEEETGIDASQVTVVAESADWLPYDLPQDVAARLWGGRFRGQAQKWFLLRYHGDDAAVCIDRPDPEFSDWRWVAPGALVDLIVPFKRPVYARVLSEFEDRL
ncbi:RNA pyrophosphohydrolase [Rhodobacteraceae bacterium CCMM004]|nr:RNA pyrophosphohydrolase [Rhodobacteraceae bacterium CCMM004]